MLESGRSAWPINQPVWLRCAADVRASHPNCFTAWTYRSREILYMMETVNTSSLASVSGILTEASCSLTGNWRTFMIVLYVRPALETEKQDRLKTQQSLTRVARETLPPKSWGWLQVSGCRCGDEGRQVREGKDTDKVTQTTQWAISISAVQLKIETRWNRSQIGRGNLHISHYFWIGLNIYFKFH